MQPARSASVRASHPVHRSAPHCIATSPRAAHCIENNPRTDNQPATHRPPRPLRIARRTAHTSHPYTHTHTHCLCVRAHLSTCCVPCARHAHDVIVFYKKNDLLKHLFFTSCGFCAQAWEPSRWPYTAGFFLCVFCFVGATEGGVVGRYKTGPDVGGKVVRG